MANVINMGGGGINLIKGTVPAGYRVVYSDGYSVQDETTTIAKEISVLGNSLIYAPYAEIIPSTPSSERFWSLVDKDFVIQSPYKPNFADNSWEDIIDACQRKLVPESWVAGNTKTINLTSGSIYSAYSAIILGKNHDIYSDGSGKAPLTLGIYVSNSTQKMYDSTPNEGTWENSALRRVLQSYYTGYFPAVIRNAIKNVDKKTGVYSTGAIKTLSEKAFALSEIEFLGTAEYSISGEGTQYEYCANSMDNYGGIPSLEEAWLRSPSKNSADRFLYTGMYGRGGSQSSLETARVFFAFCL